MLPWASSIEGLRSSCVGRLSDAVADVPEHPTADTEASSASSSGRAVDHPGRGRFPWRTSSVVFREPAVCRLLACSRLPKQPGTRRPDRRPTPEGAPSPKETMLGVPSSGFAQRRLRGDCCPSWPDPPVPARPEGCACADVSAPRVSYRVASRRSGLLSGSECQCLLCRPKPRRGAWRSVGGRHLPGCGVACGAHPKVCGQRVPAVAGASAAAVPEILEPRLMDAGTWELTGCDSPFPCGQVRPRPNNQRRVAWTRRCPFRPRRGLPPIPDESGVAGQYAWRA